MAEIRTPEGVIVRVTGRLPELFLRIITPIVASSDGLFTLGQAATMS
jgi:hypothetical protein